LLPDVLPYIQHGFETIQVQAGYNAAEHNHAVSVPIYQTTAFDLGSAERADALFGFESDDALYTRMGNPTVAVLEQRVAALHAGAFAPAPTAIALASGMAAITYALFNAAGRGGRILTNYRLYGGTVDAFTHIYPELGLGIDLVEDADDLAAYEAAITADTRALFVESVSNPLMAVADLEALADIAHAHGIVLIVDNTLATPYLLNPFEYGADVVVYSATKALSGHGNVIAGIVVESGTFDYASDTYPQFSQPLWFLRDGNDVPRTILQIFSTNPFCGRILAVYLNYLGAALSPFDAYLILQGVETLSLRVKKQVANAQALVSWLEGDSRVAWVSYPTATESPYRDLAAKYLPRGAGSIVSFGFAGTEQQKRRFLDAVRLWGYQANIGDARSLIINPAETTHIELTPAARAAAGLRSETIRLSLGLEDSADLIADLAQALTQAFA
jgi:O-acetylhomoserine (thiol)-lyase